MSAKTAEKVDYSCCIVYDLALGRVSRWTSLYEVFAFLLQDRKDAGVDMSAYENADEARMLELVEDLDYELRVPTKELIQEYYERYGTR